jgi:peptidoglycan hydrolase-like protein with peptidoglycan-binding domain
MKRNHLAMLLLAIGAVLVLAACSSGDSSGDGDATSTTAASAEGDSSATTAPSSGGGSNAPSHAIVEGMQKDLKATGYYQGDLDGIYGSQTTEAIKELQRDAGITVDGRWGPETHKAMQTALGTAESDAVKELQSELKDLGYYTGDVDGVYGESTIIAVTNLQQDCGIELDGVYGPETHSCLVDLGGDA